MYSNSTPAIREIFQICLTKEVPKELLVKKRPLRITSEATFVLDPVQTNLRHPFDLEADDTPGAFTKKEQTRFYEVTLSEDGNDFVLSSEVRVKRNLDNQVISDTYKDRHGSVRWVETKADLSKVYAVIRKRAVHKETLKVLRVEFVRYIIYIMHLDEYNRVHQTLKLKKAYTLEDSFMIISYYFNSEEEVDIPIVPSKHGNAKHVDAEDFRPSAHSLKQSLKETVKEQRNLPPRMMRTEIEKKHDVFSLESDAEIPRNNQQISNYSQNYATSSIRTDDEVATIIFDLYEQDEVTDVEVNDEKQPFIQEILMRHGKQICITAYLQATISDTARFCVTDKLFGVLSIDTTFNIASYYITETAFKYLAIVHEGTQKHPWFPGPLLVQRDKSKNEFSFFWQSCVRGNASLKSLKAIGTDEDTALIEGILQETDGHTIHLLGKEHVKKNIAKHLSNCNFPDRQAKVILEDIFGSDCNKCCLYQCETPEEYDLRVEEYKDKWARMEADYTQNKPPTKFVKYFEKYKQRSMRNSMKKSVRDRANEV